MNGDDDLVSGSDEPRLLDRLTSRVDAARSGTRKLVPNPIRWARSQGFPYTAAPVPHGVEPVAEVDDLGDNYDTEWARSPVARLSRIAALETVGRLVTSTMCLPQVENIDRLDGLKGPAIFVANHHSHFDTPLLLTAIPRPWRHELVVAAAADYFFDTHFKAALAGWAYGAVPMERKKVSRTSADRAASLLDAGWSLLVFPEGGRSPDGWGQPHKGGAAYLATKLSLPVVPIHIDGTGRVLPKGSRLPSPERVTINFGDPIVPDDDMDARSFVAVLEGAVEHLADETASDWWSAKVNARRGSTTSLAGPDIDSWRRDWSSPERRPARRQRRRWPISDS